MRVFLDTNVLVSAFISRGLSSEIFRIIIKEHDLILSNVVIEELDRIFTVKLNINPEQVKEIIEYLRSFKIHKYSNEKCPVELRDKDDEKVLASAIQSGSDVIVTGDKDLLDVRDKLEIKILNPREFLELVKSS
ncbi:MAG: putative toxin-antitoxin system toxin component, PIN family [Calditrichaceae bacterium]|nr:putative toxin-antitoxin system toxin component, PIN family [Calditrichaceae bacterium]